MSDIKIGDKVRFLNSTGGGVVSRFKGKDQVLVEDEDGFEVPALIRECVVVSDREVQVHSSRRSPLRHAPARCNGPYIFLLQSSYTHFNEQR